MPPGKIAGILAFTAILLASLACGGTASTPEPRPVEVEPPVPQPNPTLAPTRTPTLRPTPTPTHTPIPAAPDNINLPPLPDFKGSVITSGMGGGPICDDFYQGPPSVIGGANLFLPARTGAICIYGLGFDKNFRVELIAPDNSITLGGNYFVSAADFGVYWRDFNLSNFGSLSDWLRDGPPDFMLAGEAYSRLKINIRWRGDLPNGEWQVRVFTDNGEINGSFSAIAPEYPSITVVDSRQDWIIPAYSTCHFSDELQSLFALAEGYPPNQDVYLYVYEQYEGLVMQSVAHTDALGSFFTEIAGPYHQNGQYFLIGSLEPLSGMELPRGNLVDCFYVP